MQKELLLSLLLMVAAALASCGDKGIEPAKPTISAEETMQAKTVDLAAVEAALKEIQGEYHWKGDITKPTEEFLNAVGPKFDHWGELLSKLSSANQRQEADQICGAIVALRNHWGPDISPWDAFLRDRFFVGDLRIDAAEFFEPVPYYPGDDKIMKLYRFSLYKGGKVVARYYLEHSNLIGNSYYVLGLSDPTSHTQVQPYGPNRPTYWALKEKVLQHLTSTRANDPLK